MKILTKNKQRRLLFLLTLMNRYIVDDKKDLALNTLDEIKKEFT